MADKILYRAVSPRRVSSPALTARSLLARVVYMHLLAGEVTCQIPGLIRAGALGVADDTGLEPADVRLALAELAEHGLVEVDEVARLIRLPGVPGDHARLYEGRNNVKGVISALSAMPTCPLRERHAAEIRAACTVDLRGLFADLCPANEPPSNPLRTPFEPPSNPVPNPLRTQEKEKEKKQEQEQEQERESALSRTPAHTPARVLEVDPPTLAAQIENTRKLTGNGLRQLAGKTGLDVALLGEFERGEAIPTRSELQAIAKALGSPDLAEHPLPEQDPGLVASVARTHHELCVDLRIVGHEVAFSGVDGHTARAVYQDAPRADTGGEAMDAFAASWHRVLARAAEEIRREIEQRGESTSARFFTVEHLGRAKTRRRYLAAHDLDNRRPAARGSRMRGPAPPKNNEHEPEIPS